MSLERALLTKSIRKLQHDLEETSTELEIKEEELAFWARRQKEIKEDNVIKYCLAKRRHDNAKSRSSPVSLGYIAEVDEFDGIAEGDEDEDDDEEDANQAQDGIFKRRKK